VNILYISRTRPQCNGNMYINPTSYEIPQFDINNPFNINITLDYSIVATNYLLDGSVKTIYYKVEPTGNIVFKVGDIGVIPPDYNELNSKVFFGFVNQSRTKENRVGYIYFPDFSFYNNAFGTAENPNYYAYLLIGTIMNYLKTTYKIQDIIFDVRGNGGGNPSLAYTVACSVGGKRNYLTMSIDPNGNPCNPDLYIADYPYIDPKEMEKVIPNSVLFGTQKRTANVIIVDDINCASAGDIFPNQFIGNNRDGELGNYTKAYIVGNIDGRLSGGVNTMRFTPVKTPDQAAIHYTSDTYGEYSIPPFSFQQDFILSFLYPNSENSISYFQKETNPVVLIPHDFSVTYSDMGYLPPTICYLNNVKPNKNDPSTWQDSYLENAIRIIRKCKPAIPKAYKYIQIGNDKPISFCQTLYQYEKPREHKLIKQYPNTGSQNLNNSNIMDTKTPKCIKCYNVVLKDSDVATKSIALTKYYSEKTYPDNPTALEQELRRYSMTPQIPKNMKTIKDNDVLQKMLKK